jgi:hypothetical protein
MKLEPDVTELMHLSSEARAQVTRYRELIQAAHRGGTSGWGATRRSVVVGIQLVKPSCDARIVVVVLLTVAHNPGGGKNSVVLVRPVNLGKV